MEENIENHISNKIPKKECPQLNCKKINNLNKKKKAKDLNRPNLSQFTNFSKEHIQTAKRFLKSTQCD